jgi:hypothetical protein
MKGRVVEYFLAAIFCVGACSTLFLHPQYPIEETQPSVRAEVSFRHVDSKGPFENCTISAAKTHGYSGFLLSLLAWEVEETEDEKEVSDFQDKHGNLPEVCNGTAFIDLLRRSDRGPSVPLFIFLHSWKHFLS